MIKHFDNTDTNGKIMYTLWKKTLFYLTTAVRIVLNQKTSLTTILLQKKTGRTAQQHLVTAMPALSALLVPRLALRLNFIVTVQCTLFLFQFCRNSNGVFYCCPKRSAGTVCNFWGSPGVAYAGAVCLSNTCSVTWYSVIFGFWIFGLGECT